MLNVNNNSEKHQALMLLEKRTKEIFNILNLKIHEGFLEGIKSGKGFDYENNEISVNFNLIKSNIETSELLIEGK